MKNRGNLIARLEFFDFQPCQQYLDTFAADLLRMNVVPFSGFSVDLRHRRSACQTAALNSTYDTILEQLPSKSISVVITGNWSLQKHGPGSLLVTGTLQKFSGILEEVSFANKDSEDGDLIVKLVKDYTFPSLKILKLGENYERCDATYIKGVLRALVARAPNLQELHTQGPIIDFMLSVLEGRSAVLVLQSVVSLEEIPEYATNKIKLEKVRLWNKVENFNVERFNRMTPKLLEACSATIHSMEVDAALAVPLMCYGIRLENVRELTMDINPGQMELSQTRILRIIKDFDFTRIFPHLEKGFILAHYDLRELLPDHMNAFVEQANACLKEPPPDRAINIKELDLSTSMWSASEFFAQMFPHVVRLFLREQDEHVFFVSIWKHWVHLKELTVMAEVDQHFEDLDSVICGIFPEEAAELRQKDEEFLEKVNIVPIKPALTCFKNLRNFFLIWATGSYDTDSLHSVDYVEPPPGLTLSKVTGLVAFARCPNLDVTLSTFDSDIYEALKHMEPFASVDYVGDGNC